MTDANDAITEARVRLKKLAASSLARKEALTAELRRLRIQREEVASGDLTPDDDDADQERLAVLAELDRMIAERETSLASAEQDLRAALSELDDLGKVKQRAERDLVRAIADSALRPDPIATSTVDRALENVRGHIADLDARARLDAPASPPRSAKEEREERELRARRELAELKAKKQREREAAAGGATTTPRAGESPGAGPASIDGAAGDVATTGDATGDATGDGSTGDGSTGGGSTTGGAAGDPKPKRTL